MKVDNIVWEIKTGCYAEIVVEGTVGVTVRFLITGRMLNLSESDFIYRFERLSPEECAVNPKIQNALASRRRRNDEEFEPGRRVCPVLPTSSLPLGHVDRIGADGVVIVIGDDAKTYQCHPRELKPLTWSQDYTDLDRMLMSKMKVGL